MSLLIRSGRVIDPANNVDAVQDLLIEHGKIVRLGRSLEAPADVEVVDEVKTNIWPVYVVRASS